MGKKKSSLTHICVICIMMAVGICYGKQGERKGDLIRNMKTDNYKFSAAVRNNDLLRDSFNKLTKTTFGFDFTDWYEAGGWGELYVPYVMMDGNQVVSNVSVNRIRFDLGGVKKDYIQIGTVMTDEKYRGQGLNGKLMEHILKEFEGTVDGIYLFGNDSVLNYYPKFGFRVSKEYEYYMVFDGISGSSIESLEPYEIQKLDMAQNGKKEALYREIRNYFTDPENKNQNDGMYMSENLGLYQFWMAAGFGDCIYYMPETGTYVAANVEGQVLRVEQVFGKRLVEIPRLARSFGKGIRQAVLGYTPVHKELFQVREHKEEDSTLFIMGEDLQRIEEKQMMFPVLSHA